MNMGRASLPPLAFGMNPTRRVGPLTSTLGKYLWEQGNLLWHHRNFTSNSNYDKPQPIPLGDAEAQKEFEMLQKQFAMVTNVLSARGETGFAEQKDPNVDENGRNKITGEINGPRGKEPTRFGDWERKGRVSDF